MKDYWRKWAKMDEFGGVLELKTNKRPRGALVFYRFGTVIG
ncbi:MAG: hypothetical protein ACJAXQ_000648 [Parvibaculaceae bacterium]|jgi:hypothetical protein